MSGYGSNASGQRLPAQQTSEAPACVQNAMMTKDKKPFTYTPGGIDLSQIKSERMAKRLARNAQAEGATGASQHNRPTQPQSPPGGAAGTIGAAAMGMPFQVLPPPPPPPSGGSAAAAAGKRTNGAPMPPPPPPSSTLAPPTNGGGLGSAPGSPNAARKSPTSQRFEPPPMGFRPEIKIPPNPMAALRKVPPPVEKNLFWKDEYVKDRSKSPMVGENDRSSSSPPAAQNGDNNNNDHVDGFKRSMPSNTTTNQQQQHETNNSSKSYSPHTNYNQQYSPQQPPQPSSPPQQPQHQQLQQHQFRSVAAPQSPAVSFYTRQTDSPQGGSPQQQPRATESPFRFAQQQQQQRTPPAISALAQQNQQHAITLTPATPTATTAPPTSAQPQTTGASAVPWRTQRSQQPPTNNQAQQQQQSESQVQSHPQPIYNKVPQQQQQPQRSREVLSPAPEPYQGTKPTNVGTLYIAPLAPSTEPQAQHVVRQQMLQQQQHESPGRQLPQQQIQQQQQKQQQQQAHQPARWMTTQPATREQPEWAQRAEENGNVVPSSLNRMKSPPPPQMQQQYQQLLQQGNGYATSSAAKNFGAAANSPSGLHLQINTSAAVNPSGPKERIVPIQLEQTPTYTPGQPSFNAQPYGTGNATTPPASYVIRSPNQFVDQGYNNIFQQHQPMREPSSQRTMASTQLNAPRMIQQQQQQQQQQPHHTTRIVPIAVEGGEGGRGPISQTPVVIQNDLRSPPVQSKSFRVLQKITDTIGDGSGSANGSTPPSSKNESFVDEQPQLQRPQYSRQMSAQQARNSPTIEQMRRMQIAQDQHQAWNPEMPQQYVHPSEQQVPEPKKYTGSAIPSRSFKILQAMTTPENAGPGQSDL